MEFNTPEQLKLSDTMKRRASIRMSFDGTFGDGYSNNFVRVQLQQKKGSETSYNSLGLPENTTNMDARERCHAIRMLSEAVRLKRKYILPSINPNDEMNTKERERDYYFDERHSIPKDTSYKPILENGVFHTRNEDKNQSVSFKEFVEDYNCLLSISNDGPSKSFTYQRLKLLEYRYDLHMLLNEKREKKSAKGYCKDFHSVVKVDTHVHLAGGMAASELLEYMKNKAKTDGDEVVLLNSDGKKQTLRETFEKIGIKNSLELTINALDVNADNTFERFDIFNSKYNPFRSDALRSIFLKIDNAIKGRYFAELTKMLLANLEGTNLLQPFIKKEFRISIYGGKRSDWHCVSEWIWENRIYSENNRWLIQIPRIYDVLRSREHCIENFQQMLDNVFLPLFEVTMDPSRDIHLHKFLLQVSGFDCVDDESKLEHRINSLNLPPFPHQWNSEENPPFAYYMYFLWANIYTLNRYRIQRGLNTFSFRPHSGESGDSVDHLASTFLLANSINHGIQLDRNTTLQYLYYITQIGISCSPLSNNSLFVDYRRNPFRLFFKRGLNVSLSTDDPLQFHLTKLPLLEEYAVAAKQWRLTECDLCEIARNSVLQCGFPHFMKRKWHGDNYLDPLYGNDIQFTNIPNIRTSFRSECLREELDLLGCDINQESPFKNVMGDPTLKGIQAETILSGAHSEYFIPQPNIIEIVCPFTVPSVSNEDVVAATFLNAALQLRKKYQFSRKTPFETVDYSVTRPSSWMPFIQSTDGLFLVYDQDMHPIVRFHSFKTFVHDLELIERIRNDGNTITFSTQRLQLLQLLFTVHVLLNERFEKEAIKVSYKAGFLEFSKELVIIDIIDSAS